MKSKFIFLFCLLATLPLANAEKKKLDLRPQPTNKIEDPGAAERLLYENPTKAVPSNETVKGKVNVTSGCTDSLGMYHQKGDSGYEACLRTLDKTKPDSANDKRKQAIGISIGN